MTAVPSLPSTVSAGGKIKATDFNLLINYLNFQRTPPQFKGSIKTSTAITASSPIKFPSIVDTASGWNASTGQYTFQYPGRYLLFSSMKWGTAPGSAVGLQAVVNGTFSVLSAAPPLTTASGPTINSMLSVSAGDVLSMQVGVGFTTLGESPADNNFLILVWVGA